MDDDCGLQYKVWSKKYRVRELELIRTQFKWIKFKDYHFTTSLSGGWLLSTSEMENGVRWYFVWKEIIEFFVFLSDLYLTIGERRRDNEVGSGNPCWYCWQDKPTRIKVLSWSSLASNIVCMQQESCLTPAKLSQINSEHIVLIPFPYFLFQGSCIKLGSALSSVGKPSWNPTSWVLGKGS